MATYQTRPQFAEAEQFTGPLPDLLRTAAGHHTVTKHDVGTDKERITLTIGSAYGGRAELAVGDWVIRYDDGLVIGLNDDAFHERYEPKHDPVHEVDEYQLQAIKAENLAYAIVRFRNIVGESRIEDTVADHMAINLLFALTNPGGE